MHLRDADLGCDLRLSQVLDEAEVKDHFLPLGQKVKGAADRLAVFDRLVRGVIVAKRVDECRRILVRTAESGL